MRWQLRSCYGALRMTKRKRTEPKIMKKTVSVMRKMYHKFQVPTPLVILPLYMYERGTKKFNL